MKRCIEGVKRTVYGKVESRCTICDTAIGTFASVTEASDEFLKHVLAVKAARKVEAVLNA